MKYFNRDSSLYDVEKMLEREFVNNPRIRIVGDMEIDHDDYNFLNEKLRGVRSQYGNLQIIDRYRLCQILGWVGYLKFENPDRIYLANRQALSKKLPQHVAGQFLQMFSDAFCEYGFKTGDISDISFDGLCQVVALQAGMHREEYSTMYEILRAHKSLTIPRLYDEQIFRQVSYRMGEIFKYLNKETHMLVIRTICDVYVDARYNDLSVLEIMNRKPDASYVLIDTFVQRAYEERRDKGFI